MAFLNDKEVGNRLKFIREGKGYSSRRFAIACGIDPSQYAKIEKGDLPITKKILDKVVDFSGRREDFILYGTIVPHENSAPDTNTQTVTLKSDYHTLYLDSLLEQKRILEEQNQFLRRNFEVSLNSIAEAQQIEIAHLKALSWYSAHVRAGENDQQTTKELMKINMRVGEILTTTVKKDS